MLNDNEESFYLDEKYFLVEEPKEFYDDKRDFTTLEAWKKCREVKLYFY